MEEGVGRKVVLITIRALKMLEHTTLFPSRLPSSFFNPGGRRNGEEEVVVAASALHSKGIIIWCTLSGRS